MEKVEWAVALRLRTPLAFALFSVSAHWEEKQCSVKKALQHLTSKSHDGSGYFIAELQINTAHTAFTARNVLDSLVKLFIPVQGHRFLHILCFW